MASPQSSSWHLKPGPYLGEISALAFLPLPAHLSSNSLPLLLAGTGSQILSYNLATGLCLSSFRAFQGVRVHGISLCSENPPEEVAEGVSESRIAAFGEKRVNLLRLRVSGDPEGERALAVSMESEIRLPIFDHWILDALFLKEEGFLAMGLSDNSVAVWDIARAGLVCRVRSPGRCLLYSMRLWGCNLESLLVASGTIYNEIIIWKLVARNTPLVEYGCSHNFSFLDDMQLLNPWYAVGCIQRLPGHEGSIFRMAWSLDGSKLISVSDDRSARIWKISGQVQVIDKGMEILNVSTACVTLYGHDARIWDCYISDSIYITVGEDCTCRVWNTEGDQLMMVREHNGRGIWRCLYDPATSLIITAGFDSAIKVHQLHASILNISMRWDKVWGDFKDREEIFSFSAPKASEQLCLLDSKSEYIRCLHFTREDALYVATNNAFLYHLQLCGRGDERWTKLLHVCDKGPIICLDLMNLSTDDSSDRDDMIAIGDGKGTVTVVRVTNLGSNPAVSASISWVAEAERQLLGIYWCKSLGCSHLFTADPRGTLKLWKITDASLFAGGNNKVDAEASLIATFQSTFSIRIVCLDVLYIDEFWVLGCGDQRGNISIYMFPSVLLSDTNVIEGTLTPVTHFKCSHGISSVTSVSMATWNSTEVQICTTGGDGCICYFKFSCISKRLEFMGMKQAKGLSIIKSLIRASGTSRDLSHCRYAAGFTSTDFLVWNLIDKMKIKQVSCGGWRRPYSCYYGNYPEIQNCFAYVKVSQVIEKYDECFPFGENVGAFLLAITYISGLTCQSQGLETEDHTIHVHRHWMPFSGKRICSRVIHMQFHGREIHTLCFISFGLQLGLFPSKGLWLATGCEDSTVRLTRYAKPRVGAWSCSQLLGEHVGGSAVRSLCFVSKIYTSSTQQRCRGNKKGNSIASPDDQFLLISVGAKQVLTSWVLHYNSPSNREALEATVSDETSSDLPEVPCLSFQWLSSHIPTKVPNAPPIKEVGNVSMSKSVDPKSCIGGIPEVQTNVSSVHKNENDWRYMAVTAFLVRTADSRFTVCFTVVAGSDATVLLRALLLPHRLWFDVASLVSQATPILTLKHVVFPSNGDTRSGNVFIVIGGSTCGAISFWDVTNTIHLFLESLANISLENIDWQRRPRTGRGSQGGRWWKMSPNPLQRNVNGHLLKKDLLERKDVVGPELKDGNTSATDAKASTFCMGGRHPWDFPADDIYNVQPLLVLESTHQSGVNCLHVAETDKCLRSTSGLAYCLLSGGDDQSLHFLVFDVEQQATCENHKENKLADMINSCEDTDYRGRCSPPMIDSRCKIRVLCSSKVISAHNSAVKGVWTDGIWVFTTGLDQRIRCWLIENCSIVEYAHLVISVPEPESLDAVVCERNHYAIAVAGRGMQMVEFIADSNDDQRKL